MRNPESYYYKQGYDAAKAYERLSSCPYNKGFQQNDWWTEGWCDAATEMSVFPEERMAS